VRRTLIEQGLISEQMLLKHELERNREMKEVGTEEAGDSTAVTTFSQVIKTDSYFQVLSEVSMTQFLEFRVS
jgi:hypothetical protein